jgi:Bifunctional DNA primase/polymerase, N-terminal
VFPCRPRDKRPLTGAGFKDATRDERQILSWWDRWPSANIGVACGASGLVVLDVDSKHGADPAEVIPDLGLEHHPVVVTGEAPEASAKHPNSLSGVRGVQVWCWGQTQATTTSIPGVEFRRAGHYVMAPPSVHPSGVPYEGDLPPVAELPQMPERIRALAEESGPGEPASLNGRVIRHGAQHTTCVEAAGKLRHYGATPDEIFGFLSVLRERFEVKRPDDFEHLRRVADDAGRWQPGDDWIFIEGTPGSGNRTAKASGDIFITVRGNPDEMEEPEFFWEGWMQQGG